MSGPHRQRRMDKTRRLSGQASKFLISQLAAVRVFIRDFSVNYEQVTCQQRELNEALDPYRIEWNNIRGCYEKVLAKWIEPVLRRMDPAAQNQETELPGMQVEDHVCSGC